jgi:hypothetical protein
MKIVAGILVASVSLTGCEFAVKHPPYAAAITGAAVGLAACEVDGPSQKTCAIIGGSAALGLGLIAAVAMWLAGPTADEPQVIDPNLLVPDDDRPVHVPTRRPPPREPTPIEDPAPAPAPAPAPPAPPAPAPEPPPAPPAPAP